MNEIIGRFVENPFFKLGTMLATPALMGLIGAAALLIRIGILDPMASFRLDHQAISAKMASIEADSAANRITLSNFIEFSKARSDISSRQVDDVRSDLKTLAGENVRVSINLSRLSAIQEGMMSRILSLEQRTGTGRSN